MQPEEIFLLAPRSLQRLLAEGQTAIQDGRYAEGIAALGGVLYEEDATVAEDLRGQDFFLVRPARGNYTQSLKNQAIRILSQLPEEGRQVLELQFGVTARKQLDDAISKRDILAIEDVARRFAHCQAGHDAMILLAQSKLSEGYSMVAADILQSLLDFPDARRRFGVRLAFSAAMAWLQAGKVDRATATLQLAARDFPNQSLTIGGQQIPIENAEAILSATRAWQTDGLTDRTAESWLTMGGNASRNAKSKSGMPLPNERWEWVIHSSRPEGLALREREEILRKSTSALLPRLELRTLDGLVMSRTNDSSLVGIDLESGLLVWRRPSSDGVAPLKRMTWDRTENPLSNELLSRVWGATSFGRFTCDSDMCYQVVYSQEDTPPMRGMAAVVQTRLEGISIARQGAILWSIGGDTGDEPALASAYFLGPPLPFGGQLYSLIEVNGEIDLVVLEPATGKLVWRQQIATSPFLPIQTDPHRQAQGLTPSISDGVIICPTGVGGIVALDLLTRSFRWGTTYSQAGATGGRGNGFNFPGGAFGSAEYDPLQSRWHDESLIVEKGVAVVTPPESDLLICYDLLTGEQLFSRKRGEACYVAGVDESNLIVVYPSRVQAIDLTARRSRWEIDFPDGLMLSGKGVWLEHGLLLPLTNRTLIEVDFQSGKIARQAVVAQPLGNLVAHQGQILSVGPTSITCYHTRDELEKTVEQRLGANPQDTWGMNHRSQLLLADKKYLESLELLLASYELNPNDDDTRFYLADTMLSGLRYDFERFAKYTDRLDSVLMATPQLWLSYLQLLAQGMLKQGDWNGAFQRLWEMMRERHAATIAGSMARSGDVKVTDHHSVELDHWIASQLGECFDQFSEEERVQASQQVLGELDRTKGTVLSVRRQLMKFFKQISVADKDNLLLAQALLDRGEQLGAEQLLQFLSSSNDSNTQKTATDMLRRDHSLDEILRRSTRDSGEARPGVAEPRELDDWHVGMVVPQVSSEAIYSVGRYTELLSQRFGRPAVSLAVADRSLAFYDVFGNPIYNLAFRQATSDLSGTFVRAEMRGGLILLETMSELVAFDFYRGFDRDSSQAMLWRYSLDSSSPLETFQPVHASFSVDELLGIATQRRKSDGRKYAAVGPLISGIKVVQSSNKVIGLDAHTGKSVWEREGYSDQTRFAGSSTSSILAIVDPKSGLTHRVDARDGSLLDTSTFLVKEMQERTPDRGVDIWNHWYSMDDWLIDYRAEGNSQVILRVWSPLREEVLAEWKLPKGARAGKTDDGSLAALDPTGKLHIVDLMSSEKFEASIPAESRLTGLQLLRFGQRIVVASNSSSGALRLGQSHSDVLINGSIYCFDLQKGQLCWAMPGRLNNMSIPLMQPRSSPFMVAFQPNGSAAGFSSSSIILIDLRDGRVASKIDELAPEQTVAFSMRLYPEDQQIAVAMGELNFRFLVTDQDRPPEPVVHFGSNRKQTREMIRDESSLFK